MRKQKGFLLTEILIVVTILLIIAASAIPSLLCSRMPTILTLTAQPARPLNEQ
jgi:prepilin-type N-terminal cleavage/methylation domain-containing protein